MWKKIVTELIVNASKIAGRALMDAMKQEFKAGATRSARAAAAGAKKSVEDSRVSGMMTVDEAKMILNIPDLDKESIENNYKYLFDTNDKKTGGSFYLQSKVFRAKERLDIELKKEESKDTDPSR